MQEEDLNLVGRRGQLGSLQLGPDLLDAEPERKNVPGSGMWCRSAFGISLAEGELCFSLLQGNAALDSGTAEQSLALEIP